MTLKRKLKVWWAGYDVDAIAVSAALCIEELPVYHVYLNCYHITNKYLKANMTARLFTDMDPKLNDPRPGIGKDIKKGDPFILVLRETTNISRIESYYLCVFKKHFHMFEFNEVYFHIIHKLKEIHVDPFWRNNK